MRKFLIIEKPLLEKDDTNLLLRDFCDGLGLFSERDKEKSCFRVFVELVKAEKERDRLSSDEIAENANLSRATVVHHIDRLEKSGLIRVKKNRYFLTESRFEGLMEFIEKDIERVLKDFKRRAKLLDRKIW